MANVEKSEYTLATTEEGLDTIYYDLPYGSEPSNNHEPKIRIYASRLPSTLTTSITLRFPTTTIDYRYPAGWSGKEQSFTIDDSQCSVVGATGDVSGAAISNVSFHLGGSSGNGVPNFMNGKQVGADLLRFAIEFRLGSQTYQLGTLSASTEDDVFEVPSLQNNFSNNTVTFDIYKGYDKLKNIEIEIAGQAVLWAKTETTARYSVSYLKALPSAYAFRRIKADDISTLRLIYVTTQGVYHLDAFYQINGEKWNVYTTHRSNATDHTISVSELTDTYFPSTGDTYTYKVKTDFKENGNDVILIGPSVSLVHFASNPLSNFKPVKTAYENGDTLLASTLAADMLSASNKNALITYEDGTKVHISELNVTNNPTASIDALIDGKLTKGLQTLAIAPGHRYEDVKVNLSIGIGGQTYTTSYSVTVPDVYPVTFEISGQRLEFNVGDNFEYGANATARLFNGNGEQIADIPSGVSELIAQGFLVSDASKIGRAIKDTDITGNGTASLSLSLPSGYSKSWDIYVSYCDNLILDPSTLPNFYVDKGVSTSVAELFENLAARYDYNKNTSDGIKTTTTIAASSFDYTPKTTDALNADQTARYSVSVVPSECPKQTLTAEIEGRVIVNRYTGIDVSAVTLGTYYEGREGKFQLPNNRDLIKKVWNNLSKEPEQLSVTEQDSLKYCVPGNETSYLSVGDTIGAGVEGIVIELTVDGTTFSATAPIKRIPDPIIGFEVKSAADFTLGNKASVLYENGVFELTAKYQSGAVKDFSDKSAITFHSYDAESEEYGDEEVIMSSEELATLHIKYDGQYFDITTSGKLLPKTPTGQIKIPDGARKSFKNDELVDYRSLFIEVNYPDCDKSVSQTLALDEGNVATASNYSIYNEKLKAFNGTKAFNLEFSGPSTTQTLAFKALNRFDGSVAITATLTVTVYQINAEDITKIEIKNPTSVYYIGQTFLNAGDATEVEITLSDGIKTTLKLKDAPSLFSTEPKAGTSFTKLSDSTQVTVSVIGNENVFATYNISVLSAPSTATTIVHDIVAVLMAPTNPKFPKFTGSDLRHVYNDASGNTVCRGYYMLVDAQSTTIDEDGARVLKSNADPTFYGYLEDCFNASLSARVILFKDYSPPVDGQSNIEVEFTCYVEGNADRINKCRIAKLFGNQNAKNRLFVSGNPDYPNCDWHSGEPGSNAENGDFSYFGDMGYCFYGQTDNEIMGYDIVATDKMVALKSRSKVEPTNYFRTSSLVQAIDASGNAVSSIGNRTLYMEAFPLATGNIGEGALVMNGIVNLNGDTIFIASDNTIRGLDISGQVGDSQRVAYSRSRYIDPELKGLDLSNALLWTNNDKLFLCLEDRAYITDYRTYNSETGQYEWFAIDVGGITALCDIDGVIYYGDGNGNLRRFEEGRYSDCEKIFVEAGGTLASEIDDRFGAGLITYENSINQLLDENGDYTFSAIADSLRDRLFYRVGEVSSEKGANVDFVIDYEKNVLRLVALGKDGEIDGERYAAILDELAMGGKLYLNRPTGSVSIQGQGQLTEYYRAYTLEEQDTLDREYKLIDADGNEVALSGKVVSGGSTINVKYLTKADLCKPLDGQYQVTDIDKSECTFRLTINGRPIRITEYGDQNALVANFPSELHKHTPVKAYFISAPAILGSLSHRKTIWAWTLTGYKERNDLEVCKATNERNLEDMKTLFLSKDRPVGFSFNSLSFEALDFEKSTIPRKHTYIRPISVPFLCFGFRSGKDAPSVLTAVSIVYSTPLLGKGRY